MNRRNQSLDVLRGIAVLMVLLCHYNSEWFGFFGCGVDLFFVLSGFLVSGLLFDEYLRTGSIMPWRFWVRRGFKIYPSFYALIIITAAVYFALVRSLPPGFWGEVSFLQNYVSNIWDYSWSLAVEEHFYLLLPLMLLVCRKSFSRHNPFWVIPIISASLSGVCLLLRIQHAHAAQWAEQMGMTHLRIDELFSGVTIGYYSRFNKPSFNEACSNKLVLGMGLSCLAAAFLVPLGVAQTTFAYVGFTCLVPRISARSVFSGFTTRAVAFIGAYSYSIYLWHGPAKLVYDRLTHTHIALSWLPLYLLFAIGLGIGMAKLIEMPFLRLRDKLVPSIRTSLAIPSVLPETRLATAALTD